jgi:hypothetical protein
MKIKSYFLYRKCLFLCVKPEAIANLELYRKQMMYNIFTTTS